VDRRQESLTTKGAVQEPVKERHTSFPPHGEPPHEVAQVRGWTEDTGAFKTEMVPCSQESSLERSIFCCTKTWKKDETMTVNISGGYGARRV